MQGSPTQGAQSAAPRLERTLGLRQVVLFGLAYMTPLIVLGTFGVLAAETDGAVPSAYLLALVAMLFTAYSYGRMASAYPVAGSAYTYVRRTIGQRLGFLVGWAVLLDYLFLPMVIWLIGGAYLSAEFPSVPTWVWIVSFIGITTVLNVLGVRVAANVNTLLMTFQVLVLVLFVAFSIGYVIDHDGGGALVSSTPFGTDGTTISTLAAGAAIAAYSFLGFDAVTTLTEETVEPKRTMPRAIMLVALIGGAIFVVTSYTTQLVHPGGAFEDTDSAVYEIARTMGGSLLSSIIVAGLIVAQGASGLAAQASGSRLMYAMGRDGVLPRKIFGYVHPRLRTPALNIGIAGLVGLIALKSDVATSTSFINFGAFIAFTFVNLSVIGLFFRELRGRGGASVFAFVLVPAAGAAFDIWLLTKLDSKAVTIGLIWLGIGVALLAYLTRMFRVPPPEMHFEPDDEELPVPEQEPRHSRDVQPEGAAIA
jgi:amino acid transporter